MAQNSSGITEREGAGWQRFFEKWVTDILGILAPGFYFLILLSVVVALFAWLYADFIAGGDSLKAFGFVPENATRSQETKSSVKGQLGNATRSQQSTSTISDQGGDAPPRQKSVFSISNQVGLVGWVAIIVVSYVLGFILYRQDPKEPDSISFLRDYESSGCGERVQWVDYPDCIREDDCPKSRWHFCPLSQEISSSTSQGKQKDSNWVRRALQTITLNSVYLFRSPPECWRVQFPYRQLRRYLLARRMPSLAAMVRWGWQKEGHNGHSYVMRENNRSKHFINRIKDWIRCESPDAYSEIARNEAQVRLVSSVWYATKTAALLLGLYTLISFVGGVVFVVSPQRAPQDLAGNYLGYWHYFLAGLLALFVLAWFKAKIEDFIHYQRVREITKILFMADFVRHAVRNKSRLSSEVWEKADAAEMQAEAGALLRDLQGCQKNVPKWLSDMANGKKSGCKNPEITAGSGGNP